MTPAQYNEYQRQADVIEQAKKWKKEQEKKMTSIEWLWEQIPFEFTSKRSAFEVFEQAKEMHKNEIINACKNFGNLNGVDTEDYEQYYQETFKNKIK